MASIDRPCCHVGVCSPGPGCIATPRRHRRLRAPHCQHDSNELKPVGRRQVPKVAAMHISCFAGGTPVTPMKARVGVGPEGLAPAALPLGLGGGRNVGVAMSSNGGAVGSTRV